MAFSRHDTTYFPDIAIDGRGTLHLAWTENDGASAYGIYYKRSTDGGRTWSQPTALERQGPVYYYRTQLKAGVHDELHAVWELVEPADAEAWAPIPIGFVYAHSNDGGATWSEVSFLGKGDPGRSEVRPLQGLWPVQPAVGIDGTGQILLVWRELKTNLIYYQQSRDGSSWSPPTRIPGIAQGISRPFDRYDMATDADGQVHLVGVGYAAGSETLALFHTEWNGTSWSAPDTVVSAPPYPEWPRIVVSEGNRLHVVWFDGDSVTTSRTPIGVRYSAARSSATSVAPESRPQPSRAAETPVPRSSGAAMLPQASRVRLAERTPSDSSGASVPSEDAPMVRDSDRPLLFAVLATMAVLLSTVAITQVLRRRLG